MSVEPESDVVLQNIEARAHVVGGVPVRRALPTRERRQVGPFTFLDHMGPAQFEVGRGIDVPPHPHIGLATVTYLFEGELVHRDSLGSQQSIVPGDVNWMLAGKGVVHSERSSAEARAAGVRLHGVQVWLALPRAHEEDEPYFEHHAKNQIPHLELAGVSIDVIAGSAFGARAPTRVASPTLYAHALLQAQAQLQLDTEHEERAAYIVEGSVQCVGKSYGVGSLIVLRPGVAAVLSSAAGARCLLLGGARLDGERYLLWNFVASDKQRLQRAKQDWIEERFPLVPGDEHERVPMPVGA